MDKFKKRAIALGLCGDWQDKWRSEDLIGMYLDGISWCMKKKFPTLADMLPYDKELELMGVYNQKDVQLQLSKDTYVFNNSKGVIEISKYAVSRVYVSLNSVIDIRVKDRAILYIDTFDNVIVRLHVEEGAQCTVEQHECSAIQIITGNAKVNRR